MSVSHPTRAIAQPIEEAVREVAPWIAHLARTGYFAKAVLYAAIGVLAAQAALGYGGETTDMYGALREVLRAPMGEVLLLICALGLAAYAIWRAVDAITDVEGHGHSLGGAVDRFGAGLSAATHGTLAVAAFRLATRAGTEPGANSQRLAGRLLHLPAGEWLTWAVALGLLAYGILQIFCGCAAKLDRQLNLTALHHGVSRYVIHICRVGIAARGIVFAVIGILLIRAVSRRDPGQAGGIRESLEMLAGSGRWVLAFVAVGLIAYAVYEVLNGKYRRIP